MVVTLASENKRFLARDWFFAGCVIPVLVFTLATGLRLSAVIALIALCFSFVQLRLARDSPPLA